MVSFPGSGSPADLDGSGEVASTRVTLSDQERARLARQDAADGGSGGHVTVTYPADYDPGRVQVQNDGGEGGTGGSPGAGGPVGAGGPFGSGGHASIGQDGADGDPGFDGDQEGLPGEKWGANGHNGSPGPPTTYIQS